MNKSVFRSLIAIVLVSMCSTAAVLASERTWVLKQTGDRVGKIIVYIYKNAVKIEKPGFYTIVCAKPDWKVVFFNAKRRIISELTFDDFQRKGLYGNLVIFNAMPQPQKHVLDQRIRSTFKGVTVVAGAIPNKNRRKPGNESDFLVAPEITGDEHVFIFLRRYLQQDMPTDCMVIEWRSHKGRPQFMQSEVGKQQRGLVEEVTTEDIKQMPYNPRDFACPTDFKRVAYTDITIGSGGDVIEDFLPSEPH